MNHNIEVRSVVSTNARERVSVRLGIPHRDRSIRFLGGRDGFHIVQRRLFRHYASFGLPTNVVGRFHVISLDRRNVMFKAQGSIGVALALVVTASASADMVTFWKTTDCPNIGTKEAISAVRGVMEAPVVTESFIGPVISVGGPFCNVGFNSETILASVKSFTVFNASIVPTGVVQPDETFACVVCQYPNKVIFIGGAMPAVSISALAFLGGGLAMLGLARLRRRQAQTTG